MAIIYARSKGRDGLPIANLGAYRHARVSIDDDPIVINAPVVSAA